MKECQHCGAEMLRWDKKKIWICNYCEEGLNDAVVESGFAMIARVDHDDDQ
ncbi:hypothetical protein C8P63_1469 [Melghirimyces profundicolus]|uniref:Uncharacterized protein n=1 Tax=Melghirimyces profundicolus TaxID=1242148 RepID=A0A2T6AWW7_9BACL|nr:hypothetical protein [Melghirimyces profundicolus]PTX48300.1 hypothetical protein C8P63_1469 [Melghirimyces profundicolus]